MVFVAQENSRVKQLQELELINKTIIIFESASRLIDLLHDIRTVMGERYVSVIRELTKIYEESDLLSNLSDY